jgi:hypothetical protein
MASFVLKGITTSICTKDVECTDKEQWAFWRENNVWPLTIRSANDISLFDFVTSITEA